MKKYQKEYASIRPQMYDETSRIKKAERIVLTLKDYYGAKKLKTLRVLDVGASTGIIDNILADSFKEVVGIDIDEGGIKYARSKFKKRNLLFKKDDAMKLSFKNGSFDVVICTHVYEHVPSAKKLFSEIKRVLKPKGVCYLAAVNALWPLEPHHNLPFLSYLPKSIANVYIRIIGKNEYYETLATYWGLMRLTNGFTPLNYTDKIILNPKKFGYSDKIMNKIPTPLRKLLASSSKYISPTTFWLLRNDG